MDEIRNRIVIPVKGLSQGEHSFNFAIGKEFFQDFENGQIKDADCTLRVSVIRHQTLISVNCIVGGFVVVECDRCLDDLTLKVDLERGLTIGFGSLDVDEESSDDVMIIDAADAEVCLDQFVYDYICLSLPLVKVHPQGKCNPDMLKYIGESRTAVSDSPFQNLKEMIDNKNN